MHEMSCSWAVCFWAEPEDARQVPGGQNAPRRSLAAVMNHASLSRCEFDGDSSRHSAQGKIKLITTKFLDPHPFTTYSSLASCFLPCSALSLLSQASHGLRHRS